MAINPQTQQRHSLYALISRLLIIEVNEELIDTIKNDEFFISLFPDFTQWSKYKELSTKDLIQEYLNVDFTDISLLHLIPYESFYKRDDQMIDSGGNNKVIDFYNEYGFRAELVDARAISPDHIGIELEFMYKLIDAQLQAEKDNDKQSINDLLSIQQDFMTKHPHSWAAMYLINMKNEAATPFYHDVATLALEFILSDYEYIKNSIND